jgi:hypothetical protein
LAKIPKGKKWSPEESLHLAEAWIDTSEDVGSPEVKGTNQDSEEFWGSVFEAFKKKGPEVQSGVYGDRALTAIMNHWKDQVSRDVKKFNKALLKVHSSNLSGVTHEEKVNIAVAINLGKTDVASYRHQDFEAKDWKFYCALCYKLVGLSIVSNSKL